MKKYLNDHWRWENYRDFFNITVFRYLVLWFSLVPLLASLLAGLETPVQIPIGEGPAISIALAIPFAWQILWLSSFFFLLAWCIYTFRCPGFIKKYHNFKEYMDVGHDPRWTVYEIRRLNLSGENLTSFTKAIITKKFAKKANEPETAAPVVQENQTIYRYKIADEIIEIGAPIIDGKGNVVKGAERGLFWEIFSAFSGSRFKTRALILLLLGCSALCFIVVFVQHVFQGGKYVVLWLSNI